MDQINNFIDTIHSAHLDNARNVYSAKPFGHSNRIRSITPLTNFVFEYFLFNSLYAVDWQASMESEIRIDHPKGNDGPNESKQQRAFIAFCKNQFRNSDAKKISDAFLPLAGLDIRSAGWASVTEDSRITRQDGDRFFSKVVELGKLAQDQKCGTTKATFGLIDDCCHFVYQVRNNIFHGSKSLGKIYDSDQSQRISVYDLFVRCLNSLFFLAVGKSKYGSACAQLPIVQQVGEHAIRLSLQDVYRLLSQERLKSEDSQLHWRAFRSETSATVVGNRRPALFYPSAGYDLLFPVLVGLPHCTDFYFFEEHPWPQKLSAAIRNVANTLKLTVSPVQTDQDSCECHEFEFDNVTRRIWCVRRNNKAVLDLGIELAFYFRRGDSIGEGGSGQKWDSALLPHLLQLASLHAGLRIVTDGEPGGLDEDVKSKLRRVTLSNSHRDRDYFYGVIGGE